MYGARPLPDSSLDRGPEIEVGEFKVAALFNPEQLFAAVIAGQQAVAAELLFFQDGLVVAEGLDAAA